LVRISFDELHVDELDDEYAEHQDDKCAEQSEHRLSAVAAVATILL
jgi:hypothetical protein